MAEAETLPPEVAVPAQPVAVRPPMEAGGNIVPIIPRDLSEIAKYADWVIAAAMIPASYEVKLADANGDVEQARKMTAARLMLGIEKGLEVGMGPVTALSTIMIINNRPCLWGDGAVALCQQKGKVDWVKTYWSGDEGADDWTAHFEIKRVRQEVPYHATFSVKDAKRAKLWQAANKRPWIEYPQRMLLARARAYALREGFADCLMGLGIAEEVQDLPEAPKPVANTAFLDDAPAPAIEHQAASAEPMCEDIPEMEDITPDLGEDAIERALAEGKLRELSL